MTQENNENINLSDGVNFKELGKLTLVGAFVLTLFFAFYKAIVSGDFPNNVTDFLIMMGFAIGFREGIPMVGKGRR